MDGGVVAVRHGHVFTPVISVLINVSPSQIIVSVNVSQKHR